MMKLIEQAHLIASDQPPDETTVVLFPNSKIWQKDVNKLDWTGTHVRYSNVYSGLKSLPIKNLVIVALRECDCEGLKWVSGRLGVAEGPPSIILVQDNVDLLRRGQLPPLQDILLRKKSYK